ncbi:MAG: B12-binding domain-containing radical SAM protein [Clostridiales bacterium]|nr:B12-binding domain-containing radical SAM protein [Clostridiales bacterium]
MKILLIAINAKYIHSNPAVYSLRAYAGEQFAPYIEIAEYTINNRKEEILADIFRRKPDVAAFSCYIWNWSMVSSIIAELPKIMEDMDIWLGGPEVSYNPDETMEKNPMVAGIMTGEGEETFKELAEYYCSNECIMTESLKEDGLKKESLRVEGLKTEGVKVEVKALDKILGIVYRAKLSTGREEIRHTPLREPMDISKLPFLYNNLSSFENRIIYYESSRGCPYRCSYCLSSIDKTVRLRDIETVKKELQFFLDSRVKQVKFVDRTFNCNREHAREIWKYLAEHDNGVTNFHFEIAADIISEEDLAILAKLRSGLAQMEIGVQTVNAATLKEIRRNSDLSLLREVVAKIINNGNIHVHLDLIAGLPFEDYESFTHSFNTVYEMQPHQLQLGFLKVLKGSYMYEKAVSYGIQYTDCPPYEVLSTKWLSYEKLRILKQVEEMVELYYNSNQFTYTMPLLQKAFPDAFTMYKELSEFYHEGGYSLMTPSRIQRYQILLDYVMNSPRFTEKEEPSLPDKEITRQVLTFDLYLRENIKSRPNFAKDLSPYKQNIRNIHKEDQFTHIDVFDYPVWETDDSLRCQRLDMPLMVKFNYKNRNPLTYEAEYTVIRT